MEEVPDVGWELEDLRKRRSQVGDDAEAARNAGEVKAYLALLSQLAYLEDKLERAENAHIRRAREGPLHPSWQIRSQQLERQFLEFYGNRGPQYEILVRQLVAAEIRFEQAQASGRDIDIHEFKAILRAAQECISMLQKYTESTKIDHSEGRMEGIQVVLRIVEEILAPEQPELYAHIVDTLVERAKSGGRVLRARANPVH